MEDDLEPLLEQDTSLLQLTDGRIDIRRPNVTVQDPKNITVIVGDDKYPKDWKKKNISVSRIMVLEKHFSVGGDLGRGGDIALLELTEALDLNMYTPACLSQTLDEDRFDAMFSGLQNGMPSAMVFAARFNGTERKIRTKNTNITSMSECLNKLTTELPHLKSTAPHPHWICGKADSSNRLIKVRLLFCRSKAI